MHVLEIKKTNRIKSFFPLERIKRISFLKYWITGLGWIEKREIEYLRLFFLQRVRKEQGLVSLFQKKILSNMVAISLLSRLKVKEHCSGFGFQRCCVNSPT